MAQPEPFSPMRAADGAEAGTGAFVVDLGEFEGPLDRLLDLARAQKVDLGQISIRALVDQYLFWLQEQRALRLEVAAEYLVMAAWLAYLKSQLLLPKEEREEPSAEDLAAALADRLRKLDAIRKAADAMMDRPRLFEQRLPRGAPEGLGVRRDGALTAALPDLLRCYGRLMGRRKRGRIIVRPRDLMSVEEALARLTKLLTGREWQQLSSFLPPDLKPGIGRRAALAASLVASLELAKRGEIELDQIAPYAPIMIRCRPDD